MLFVLDVRGRRYFPYLAVLIVCRVISSYVRTYRRPCTYALPGVELRLVPGLLVYAMDGAVV